MPLKPASGRGRKGEQDDDGKKAAAGGEGEALGDLEALTTADFNRWLVTEENWASAEQCRQQHIEGEQFRKARDDKHRERGQARQQDTVEQMKEAKTKVDAHRRTNLEQGSAVKRDVIAWQESARKDRERYNAWAKDVKEKQLAAHTAVHDEGPARRRAIGKATREEVDEWLAAGRARREREFDERKKFTEKVKTETSDAVIDDAKKTFFLQRKTAAKETQTMVESWATERGKVKQAFFETAATKVAKSKGMREGGKAARVALEAKRRNDAVVARERKEGLAKQKEQQAEEWSLQVKESVNAAITERFVPTDSSRRMLQHPHYSEVSAVVADVTSPVSREIAASPKRTRRPPSASGANPALTLAGQSAGAARR